MKIGNNRIIKIKATFFLLSFLLIKGEWSLYADSFERYCFSSQNESHTAFNSLKNISAPVDTINQEKNCLVVSTSDRRIEVIQKYLLKLYPSMDIIFSSLNSAKEECRLRIDKETSESRNNNNLKIKKTVTFGSAEISTSKKETSLIRVLSNEDFEISANEEIILGNCRYINSNLYEIKFSMVFSPKPVNVYDQTTYKQKEGTSVSTSIRLSKGQRLRIADIKSKLDGENKSAGFSNSFSSTGGDKKTEVFLSLE